MMRRNLGLLNVLGLGALVAGLAAACGGDDDSPSDEIGGSGGKQANGGTTAGGTKASGGDSSHGGSSETSGGTAGTSSSSGGTENGAGGAPSDAGSGGEPGSAGGGSGNGGMSGAEAGGLGGGGGQDNACDPDCLPSATCEENECVCIAAYLVESPVLTGTQVNDSGLPDRTFGTGVFTDSLDGDISDLLMVVFFDDPPLMLNTQYAVDVNLPGAPTILVIRDFGNPGSIEHVAVGDITFNHICSGGFDGVATGLTFSSATGDYPETTVDPDACTFSLPSLTFSFGTPCP
jgi:hypothetical protein